MDTTGPLRAARRVTNTARNIAEVVRFGGLETDEVHAPFTVVTDAVNYRLRRYFADDVAPGATAILLVPPLMITAEVWDVSPSTSAVTALHHAGLDPWVIDFGDPGREPGGRERTLTDHVLAVNDAVDRVRDVVDDDVVLAGYSQGGMFVYQAAALRRGMGREGIDLLITFGSPVDTTAPLPIPLAPDVAARLAGDLANSGLLRHIAMPGWLASLGFKLLTPARSVQDRVRFLLALHDRDELLPRERQRRFLDSKGWTAYSGPAIAELLDQFVAHNRMLEGGFVIDDRLVSLADLDLPVLTFVGTRDGIGHPDSVRAIRRAAPRAEVYEVPLATGHFGLVVGSLAEQRTWPAVAAWVDWRAGRHGQPPTIVAAEEVEPEQLPRIGTLTDAATQAVGVGIDLGRAMVGSAVRVARFAHVVAREAPTQLTRLARLDRLEPTTRVSLGLLLDEQARRAPDDILFLFGDRAHRQREVKTRVDNVVRGLLEIGVGASDRVAILMGTRPSAFILLAALSRLGATAVLLRPDGDPRREARLADVSWLVTDPDHVGASLGVPHAVLGGGGGARTVPEGVLDLERIDPGAVVVPDSYLPNPGRASDVAMIMFTGAGAQTRALRITNRRLALSALGTASAAGLGPRDTVYSVTPIHHSSTLLMSVGGAVAGGARFAIASGEDPNTFWTQVRRYGATHVSYTWTSLSAIVNAAPHPNEEHHPIRMFFGSGMPRNLARHVTERFAPASVLEFYASAEGDAILANRDSRGSGSLGRPLPGTAAVVVAGYDLAARALERDAEGRCRECAVDEIGLLLADVQPFDGQRDTAVLRDLFAPGDAWRSTGDLFLRDGRGELWLAGPVAELIDTADGVVLPIGARTALGTIPAADLVVTYGVREAEADVLVAAMTLRPGTEVSAADLYRAVRRLPPAQRPRYVQVRASIPVTTWHRPQWQSLRRQGVPTPGRNRRVWRLAADGLHYDLIT